MKNNNLRPLSEEQINALPKLDPTSDRFRICPNCKIQFMTNHLSRDFCNDKCADDYYNKHRRLTKQATVIVEENKMMKPHQEVLATSSSPPTNNDLEKNIQILDQLKINPEKGSFFSQEELNSLGFNFFANSGTGKVPDNDPACHYVSFAQYRIFRIGISILLIKLNN